MTEAGRPASSRCCLAFAALLFCVAGCAARREVDENETRGTVMRALCEYVIRCGIQNFERVEDCMSEPGRSCVVEDLDRPLEGAAGCARGLRAMSCTDITPGIPACEGPLASWDKLGGRPDLGAGCSSATSCVYGQYCAGQTGVPACGVCRPLPRAGEPCESSTGCAVGLFCNAAHACEASKANGASCTASLECREGSCAAAKCASPSVLRQGESCLVPVRCEPGTVCTDGLCRALVSKGERCLPRQCFRGLTCVEGLCAEVPGCRMGVDGDSCNIDAHCAAGFACDPLLERCQPSQSTRYELGAPCKDGTDCFVEYCFEGKCTDPGPVCTGRAAVRQP